MVRGLTDSESLVLAIRIAYAVVGDMPHHVSSSRIRGSPKGDLELFPQ